MHEVGRASLVRRGLHLGKGCGPIRTNCTQLAVEIGTLDGKRGNRLCRRLVSIRPVETRPRQQARITPHEPRVDAIAVILDLVRSVWTGGRRFDQQRELWPDELGRGRVGSSSHWRSSWPEANAPPMQAPRWSRIQVRSRSHFSRQVGTAGFQSVLTAGDDEKGDDHAWRSCPNDVGRSADYECRRCSERLSSHGRRREGRHSSRHQVRTDRQTCLV
jgi:hypothetical protein